MTHPGESETCAREGCEIEFEPPPRARHKRYCSTRCRERARYEADRARGLLDTMRERYATDTDYAELMRKRSRSYRAAHGPEIAQQRKAGYSAAPLRWCVTCRAEFRTANPKRRYCSAICRRRAPRCAWDDCDEPVRLARLRGRHTACSEAHARLIRDEIGRLWRMGLTWAEAQPVSRR